MTNTTAQKRQFMELTNRLFKGVENKAPNSLTPSIMYRDIWKKDVERVLFYAPIDEHAASFFDDKPTDMLMGFETLVKDNKYSNTKDLIIKIYFFDENDFPVLKTCIIGKDAKRMKEFLDALSVVDEITIIIANSNHDFICFHEFSWDYNLFKKDLDEVHESLSDNLKNPEKILDFSGFKNLFKIQK